MYLFCSPNMERETRFELATFALARQRSTTEPFPQSGGNNRARTYDPLLVRQMLSQLSYASKPELLVYNTKLKKKLQLFFGGFSKKIKIFFHSRKAAFSRPKNPSEYYARHSRRLGILRHIERKRNIPRLK